MWNVRPARAAAEDINVIMDKNFSSYLVSRGISVAQYEAASIGEKGQILSVYEQQQAPSNVQRRHD